MKFSIIVPTYNRSNIISKCIPNAILRCGFPRDKIELIWVDDSSTDKEVEYVMRDLKPDISIIKSKNEGTLKTKNRGMLMSSGDWIVVLDSDFKTRDNWLEELNKHIEDCPYYQVYALSGHLRDRWKGDVEYKHGKLIYYKIKNPLVSGFFAFSRTVLNYVGYLDEDFGFYGLNDSEWSRRIIKAGIKMAYINIYGDHIGGSGEAGENRIKKDKAIRDNQEIFKLKIASERVFYNPTLDEYLNEVLDAAIRSDIASGSLGW